MKWAILSDVHGNLEALQAVLADVRREKAERLAFLGDVVGYGADPRECLRLLGELTDWMVAGNHDYGAVGRTDLSFFNAMARAAIEWTREQLTEEERFLLRQTPLLKRAGALTFVHASPRNPEAWNYIFSLEEAEEAFRALETEVAFIGHSHLPIIWTWGKDGMVTAAAEKEIVLQEGRKYILNVGSVGQPRDRHPESAYGIYDEDSKRYILRRIPYDVAAAQKKILQAGLPPYLARRLSLGT
ncbi:MAG: metallophosphoesterase family protein [Deltaproteobacteria bacterium]|nr:metallophosphoesterase family protein [Deltaproteobacteria bacterium]